MPSLIKRVQEATSYMIRGIRPDTWFSPLQPLQPMTNDPTVKGRQFDYIAGQNLNYRPRATELVGFRKLKALAEGSNLLRMVIERQKDLLEAFDWRIMPKSVNGKKPKEGTLQSQIDELTALLEEPEPGFDWAQWLRRFLEQVYVYDALTIYPRKTIGGKTFALDLIDGATITPLLDASGRRPVAPSPAYEQVLKGIVVADFQLTELLYFPKNPRVDRLYGYSRVQQIVDTVETEIERNKSQKLYFTAGNTTDGVFTGPTDWTTDQITTWQAYWDDLFSGNLEARRHGWWVPAGTKWEEIKQPPLKDEFDEWLARKICFTFSTSPAPFIKAQNRSNQEGQQEVAEEGGIANDMAYIKRVMDKLFRMLGYPGLEFEWSEDREFDIQVAAEIDDMQIGNGTRTINQVKDRLGLDGIGPDGDVPLLRAGAMWVTLDSVINPPDPPPPVIMAHPGDPNAPPVDPAKGAAPVPTPKVPQKGAKKVPDTKVPPPAAAAKKKVVKKSAPRALALTRPGMAKTIAATKKAAGAALKAAGADAAHQVHRALLTLGKADSDDKSTAADIAAGISLDKLGDVAEAIEPALSDTAVAAGTETIASVGVNDASKLVDQVNMRAVVFARDRAAELVGKRYDASGDLVDNPDPKWAIDDATRNWVRDTIAKGLEDNIGNDAIRDAVRDHYAFSQDRADTIVHTEIARANVQGGLMGAREAAAHGVVMQKVWLLGQDPCDECLENADDGAIELDDDFSSGDDGPPAHPNCYCSLSWVVETEEDEEDD